MSTLMSRDLNIERSSTRLHAPPGGKSSISFGDDNSYNATPTKKMTPYQTQQTAQQSYQPQQTATRNTSSKVSMSDLLSQQNKDEDEEEERKKRMNQRKGSNSSQMTAAMNHENVQPRTSTRVRQAPGGTSSIVLG